MYVLSAVGALITITSEAAWTLNGTTATDGNWTLTVAADEIGGVVGLKVTGKTMGASTDLDLSTFESDTGSKIIRLNKIFQWNTTVTSVNAPTVLRVEANGFEGTTSLTSALFQTATYSLVTAFGDCTNADVRQLFR